MESKQVLESWDIHNRINLYLLDSIDAAHLNSALLSKGRNAGEQFGHIHNVRLMWLKVSAPDLMKGLNKIEKDDALDKKLLGSSITKSAKAIRTLLEKALESDGRVKNFKPHAAAFLAYLISHESHHRGQILLALKQSGHAIDRKIQYGIWEWGVR